ncbi:MAG TPA: DivIVA domain-containing protein [archaeon]|nr:DivIVA domain-containing protein [archaeon]
MKITPLELKKPDFKRGFRGFKEDEVQSLLASAAETLEEILKENLELKTQMVEFKERLKNYQALENTLNETLIMAQRTSESARQAAEREAELIIAKAEIQAEKLIEEARSRLKSLKSEIEQLRQEKDSFLVRMRSLVASQWKMLQEEKIDQEIIREAVKAPPQVEETVEWPEPFRKERKAGAQGGKEKAPAVASDEEGLVETAQEEAQQESKKIDNDMPMPKNLSAQLGKILRGEQTEEAEEGVTVEPEGEEEYLADENLEEEKKDSFLGQETQGNEEGGEKPEVFWDEETGAERMDEETGGDKSNKEG